MKRLKLTFLYAFGCMTFLSSCTGQKSELSLFEYSGYSDTIYAMIGGHIFEYKGLLKSPLDSVEIISHRPSPQDTVNLTDKDGYFAAFFCNGIFEVLIKKRGYQSIKLINFESNPDQVSHLEAILRKGEGEIVYNISKKKINK